MVNPNPPLFVQDGEYPAKLDRNLIGGLLNPSGDQTYPLVPRPGVRAHYADANGETSLRVTISTAGAAVVAPGSAYVRGPLVDGIAAVYLITNPNPYTVPLPNTSGVEQRGEVGISVIDPSSTPGAGEGKWEPVYIGPTDTRPTNFLPLANIVIPATGAKTAPDNRSYTSALGAPYQVGSLDALNMTGAGMPWGSQAFAAAEGYMVFRGKEKWVRPPALAQVNGYPTNPSTGHQGELLWNSVTQTLSVFQGSTWITCGKVPSAVRRMEATGDTWPQAPNQDKIDQDLEIEITKAGTYLFISSADLKLWNNDANEKKPTEGQMTLKINCPSAKSVAYVSMYATVEAFKKDGDSYPEDDTNTFTLNLDIFTSSSEVYDTDGRPEGYAEQYVISDQEGVSWTGNWFGQKQTIWKALANLGPGYVNVRPTFKAAKLGYFKITDLRMTVTTT